MTDEQNPPAVTPTEPDRAADVADERGRVDNRNEELDQSPVPDPTAKDTNAGDDPQAD